MIESRMNKTITESKHVVNLMDKMKGQFAYDKQKLSRIETEKDIKPEQKNNEGNKPSEKSMKEEKTRGKKEGERI